MYIDASRISNSITSINTYKNITDIGQLIIIPLKTVIADSFIAFFCLLFIIKIWWDGISVYTSRGIKIVLFVLGRIPVPSPSIFQPLLSSLIYF